MAPGPTCGIAKSLEAKRVIKATAEAESYVPEGPGTLIVNAPQSVDEGGVWVTYKDDHPDPDTRQLRWVTVWADELNALRYAVNLGHTAKFLKWGEEL